MTRATLRHLLLGKMGTLPSFIIAGAQKSGTTSLYRYLLHHPQIVPAIQKETHYFDAWHHRPVAWYRNQFPIPIARRVWSVARGKRLISGEATPSYLFHPHAAARLARTVPDAHVIVLLRDPALRALSHYLHNCRKGVETRSFPEALGQEDALQPVLDAVRNDESHSDPRFLTYFYRARGLYLAQLRRYSHYRARNRLLVLCSEEFFRSPRETCVAAFRFLGLDPVVQDEYPVSNQGRYKGTHEAEIRQLREYFRDHNRQLFDDLKVRFPWP